MLVIYRTVLSEFVSADWGHHWSRCLPMSLAA